MKHVEFFFYRTNRLKIIWIILINPEGLFNVNVFNYFQLGKIKILISIIFFFNLKSINIIFLY
jgi:hypothetical protein